MFFLSSSFFGGGGGEEEEDVVVKGDDVIVELDATLEDLYMGGSLKVIQLLPNLVLLFNVMNCPSQAKQSR